MAQNSLLFNNIGVAVSFSPICEKVIAEVKNLVNVLGSKVVFMHVGKSSLQEKNYLRHLLHRFEFDENNSKILWLDGDPVEAILQQTKLERIDLLIAGTLEKQSFLKYIFGGVARQLSRKALCNMLVLSEPSLKGNEYKHIVAEATDHPKTPYTIATAVAFAQCFNTQKIDLIQQTDLGKLALIRNNELKEDETEKLKEELFAQEDEKIKEWVNNLNCKSIPINIERIDGKPGYVITEYARLKNADLLVLNGPDRPFNLIDRVFPHDIEFALADLPCNLLLVQPKAEMNY